MPDDLYERDALAWAERQAALLRRLAAGERLNGQVDWPNVIEEIQDVGLSELHACWGLLRRALVRLLRLHAWPESPSAGHWCGETVAFLADTMRRFTPSMRERIDLADLYADALHEMRMGAEDAEALPKLPDLCPFALDDLLTRRPDIAALLARLAVPA